LLVRNQIFEKKVFVPGMHQKYPNHKILLKLTSNKEPVIKITPQRTTIDFHCDMEWHVFTPDNKLLLAFILEGKIETGGNVMKISTYIRVN
jgi:hypothetical protein